jgi:hypothetical protein
MLRGHASQQGSGKVMVKRGLLDHKNFELSASDLWNRLDRWRVESDGLKNRGWIYAAQTKIVVATLGRGARKAVTM